MRLNVKCFKWKLSNFCLKDNKGVFLCFFPFNTNRHVRISQSITSAFRLIFWLVSVHVSMTGKYTCTDLNCFWQTLGSVISHIEHFVCSLYFFLFFLQCYTTAAGQNRYYQELFGKVPLLVQFKNPWHLTQFLTNDFWD